MPPALAQLQDLWAQLSNGLCPWSPSAQFWMCSADIYTVIARGAQVCQLRAGFIKDEDEREALWEQQHKIGAWKIPFWKLNLLEELVKYYAGKNPPAHDLKKIAASFEEKMFNVAKSKYEYKRRIAKKLVMMEKNHPCLQQLNSSGCNKMQLVDRTQAIHGGNSTNITMLPQVSQMMSSHERQAAQMPSQLMMQPVESQNQSKLPVMQMHPINFSSGNAASATQSQRQTVVQPNCGQQQNALQQSTKGTSILPQQQQLRMSHQALGFNQQNMNRQNSQMVIAQLSSSHVVIPQITVNRPSSSFGAIAQSAALTGSDGEADWREEMLEKIRILKDAYLSDLVELDEISVFPVITKDEYESLPTEKADQYRFRVHMKKKIRSLLKFLQLEKNTIPEQLKGQLPYFARSIQKILAFYRDRKDQWAEIYTGCQPQIFDKKPRTVNLTGDPGPSSDNTSSQPKQPVQPVSFHLGQNIAAGTPEASGANHSNFSLGITSSSVPTKPSGFVPSLPSNMDMHKDYYTSSSLTEESLLDISSLSTSTKSIWSSAVIGASPSVPSTVFKTDFHVASPPALVKSTLPPPVPIFGSQSRLTSPSPFASVDFAEITTPSASMPPLQSPNETIGVSQAASSSLPMKSRQWKLGANSGVLPVDSPKFTSSENFGPVSALYEMNNAATVVANGCKSNLVMPPSFVQSETADFQAKDFQRHETPVDKKKPIDRLLAAMCSVSPAALKSSAESICSVMNREDQAPHGVFNPFQHWSSFSKQSGSQPPKMKRSFEIPAWDYCPGSLPLFDTWEFEANAEHGVKRQNTQNTMGDVLYEIQSTNSILIDTVISIIADDKTDGVITTGGGMLIKLSYTTVSLAPDLKALFATSSETPVIMSAKLLVPAEYPKCSPVLVTDQKGEQLRNMFTDISNAANTMFRNTLHGMPEPRSIREMVEVWDACVRRAIAEFAQRFGGGTFSHAYGRWESCTGCLSK